MSCCSTFIFKTETTFDNAYVVDFVCIVFSPVLVGDINTTLAGERRLIHNHSFGDHRGHSRNHIPLVHLFRHKTQLGSGRQQADNAVPVVHQRVLLFLVLNHRDNHYRMLLLK